MTSNGLLAVSLFAVSMLVSTFPASHCLTIDSSHTPVAAGVPLKVTVTGAPCHNIRVVLYVNGQEIEGKISEVPGSVTLNVPDGTQGQGYTLEIECPNERVSETGQVL